MNILIQHHLQSRTHHQFNFTEAYPQINEDNCFITTLISAGNNSYTGSYPSGALAPLSLKFSLSSHLTGTEVYHF